MNKLIFHIGAHRTATTFLQRVLTRDSEKLKSIGIQFARMPRDVSPKVNALSELASGFEVAIEDAAEAFVHSFKNTPGTVLLSWEAMLGADPFSTGQLYGQRGPYLELLERIQSQLGCDFSVSLSIRRQDQLIRSWYAQRVKTGYAAEPEEYLTGIDFSSLDWHGPIEDLRGVVRRLHVAPYELLAHDPERFVLDLFRDEPDMVNALNLRIAPQNPSYSEAALNVALFANQHFPMEQETRYAFRAMLLKNMGNGAPAKILSDHQIQTLQQHYAGKNRHLIELIGSSREIEEYYAFSEPKKLQREAKRRSRGLVQKIKRTLRAFG